MNDYEGLSGQEQAGGSSVNYEGLLREAQEGTERQKPGREDLSVAYLNTSFSGTLEYPEALDELLLRDGVARANAVFGFSEVTHAQRPAAQAALEARGYRVVAPPEDSHLDLMWAVGPGLEIGRSDAHHFPRTGLRKMASRTGSKGYRHVGVQDLTVTTAGGSKVRLGHERLSPWVVEPVRRLQLRDLAQVLEEEFPPDDDVMLTVNGGDMNHIGPFRRPDDGMWNDLKDKEGWEPMLERGTATHYSGDKYSRSGKLFRAMGRKTEETQLDAVYARARTGARLVSGDEELAADEIGYTTRTLKVRGTDHYAVETTFSLPVPS